MKKTLSKFVRPLLAIAALALVVFAGSSIVLAWTGPTGAFPTGNVAAPVNTGTVGQTKQGDFASNKNIVSVGMTLSNSLVGGTRAAFGCSGTGLGLLGCYLANNDIANTDKLRAGTFDTIGKFLKGLIVDSNGKTLIGSGVLSTGNFNGVIVDPAGDFSVGKRTGWFTSGMYVSSTTGNVGITGPLTITTGSPGLGKVLTSDDDGNASWSTGAANTAFDIYEEVNTENDDQGHVYCNAGYRVLGGGGNCGQVAATNRAILVSEPTGVNTNQEGWWINCSGTENRTITTRAICMKITGATVTGTGTVAGVGGVQVAPGTWQRVTSPANPSQNNISCNTWLATAYAGKQKRAEAYPNNNTSVMPLGTNAPETCAYQFTTAQYQRLNVNIGPSTTVPVPAEQYGGAAYWSSTCIIAQAGAQFANAKPVQSCVDNASQLTTGNGQTSTKTNIIYTQVKS